MIGSTNLDCSSPAFLSSMPAFGSSSTPSFEGFGQNPAFGGFGSTPEVFCSKTSAFRGAFESETPLSVFGGIDFGQLTIRHQISVVSNPAITEEDGGTSGQTAKLESISAMPAYKCERFESCVAIAGEDYCVMAADYTRYHNKISQLTEKCVMASCGFQADLKALQEDLSDEMEIYEHRHKKPMSWLEIDHLLLKLLVFKYHDIHFTVLGGIDSKGKGRILTHCNGCCDAGGVGYNSQEELIIPPILEYELPAQDVLARLSETEAVDLVKTIFESTTRTGDKLEIVVINASGLRREDMDLGAPMDISYY